jgi:hypothetical protein
MVEVKYQGRLGNNLFQYCFGRIVAESLGYRLVAEPIPGFPKTADVVDGVVYEKPLRLFKEDPFTQTTDREQLFKKKTPGKILLDGYFQRYEYYKPCKKKIKKWLSTAETEKPYELSVDDFVVHIRALDYRTVPGCGPAFYRFTPFCWYKDILDNTNWRKLYVVTDDPKDRLSQKMVNRYGAVTVSTDGLSDFNFIKSAKRIAISASSFSWWAAWLSDAIEVYFPMVGYYDQRVRPDIDLRVDDEERFIHVKWPQSAVVLEILKRSAFIRQRLTMHRKHRSGR